MPALIIIPTRSVMRPAARCGMSAVGREGQAADLSRRAAYWPRAVNRLVAAERLVLTEP